ncbi:MAG: hypothetical protein NTU53_23550 [Planctomycetota bacterium]|nr:hypothetical protein [Planctomycetota bacterium]
MYHRQQWMPHAVEFLALLLFVPVVARAGEPTEGQLEKRILVAAESARQWSASECTIEQSSTRMRTGTRVLHWHVTVNHFGGEPDYPIGWPRIGLTLREAAARDWSGWDYAQMWVYTDTSRDALPRAPLGLSLYTPDKEGAYNRTLTELAKGKWVRIQIPLADVPRHNDVRLIQLHISESNYRHQDQLDFYLDEVTLLRYARPTLLDFAAEAAVMFADAKQIPVRFGLAGVKPGDAAAVVCELRQRDRVVAKADTNAARGPGRLALDVSRLKLEPGEYEVIGRAAGGEQAGPVRLRLVESPWKTGG